MAIGAERARLRAGEGGQQVMLSVERAEQPHQRPAHQHPQGHLADHVPCPQGAAHASVLACWDK